MRLLNLSDNLHAKMYPGTGLPVKKNDFLIMKELVKESPVLHFFANNKPLMIQYDASEKGLCAALLQDGKPVAFANRALTDTVTRYAQIVKELLAIVFSVEKFHSLPLDVLCISNLITNH